MSGWTVVPTSAANADTSAWTPVTPQPSAPATTTQPPAPQEGFWHSLGAQFGLTPEAAEAMRQHVLAHPVEAGLEALGGPAYQAAKGVAGGFMRSTGEMGKAVDALKEGNPWDAASHAISSVPIVGPAIDKGVEQYNAGNTPGEVGTALGAALQTAPMVAGGADAALPGRPTIPTPTLPSPLGDMITKPRGTVPAEFASPLELKAYADQNGIPLNAAQATEHNAPRNLQSVGERAMIGGTEVKQQIKAGQAAVMDHAQNLMNQLSPNTPDLATAGQTVQQNIAAALEREKQAARQEYAAIDKGAQGTTVDLRPVKQLATTLLGDSDFIRQNISSLDPRRASLVVQGAQNLPDRGTFTQAQQLRSALLDESRHPDVVISQQGQAWIKSLSGAVDDQMQTAAQSNPQLLSKFRAANAHWDGIQEAFNSPRSPFYQALQEQDPNKVPQKFMTQGQIGGSPYSAQLLDKYGIDKAPIKWALMGDMIKKDFGLYNGGKTLAGYSDPFLQGMFAPGELDSIYKTGAIARSMKLNTNTSGTATVEGAMHDVSNPLNPGTYLKPAAAMLTANDKFNAWLLKNPQPPSADIPAFLNWQNQRMAILAGAAPAATGNKGNQN